MRKSIKDYCIKPKYEKPERRKVIQKIPSMVYTSPEALKYIKGKDKDANNKEMREIDSQFDHIPKKTK